MKSFIAALLVASSITTPAAAAFSDHGDWFVEQEEGWFSSTCTVFSRQRGNPTLAIQPDRKSYTIGFWSSDWRNEAYTAYGYHMAAGRFSYEGKVVTQREFLFGSMPADVGTDLTTSVIKYDLKVTIRGVNYEYTTDGLPDALRVAKRC